MDNLIAFRCTAKPGEGTVFANCPAPIYLGRLRSIKIKTMGKTQMGY